MQKSPCPSQNGEVGVGKVVLQKERAWTWPENQAVVHHELEQPVGVRETQRKGSERGSSVEGWEARTKDPIYDWGQGENRKRVMEGD